MNSYFIKTIDEIAAVIVANSKYGLKRRLNEAEKIIKNQQEKIESLQGQINNLQREFRCAHDDLK